jgi:hypothetical protein
MNPISTGYLFVVLMLGLLAETVRDDGIFLSVAKGDYVLKSCECAHILF